MYWIINIKPEKILFVCIAMYMTVGCCECSTIAIVHVQIFVIRVIKCNNDFMGSEITNLKCRVQNNEFVMHGHRCRTKAILCDSFITCTEISCYT